MRCRTCKQHRELVNGYKKQKFVWQCCIACFETEDNFDMSYCFDEELEEALTCADEALGRTNADLARLYLYNLYTSISMESTAES